MVYHYVGNAGQSKEGVRTYFAGGHDASAHFVIDDRGILQIVPPDETAYHAGTQWWNRNTLGIEMCHPDWTGKLTASVWDKAVYLGAALCFEYGLNPRKKIVRHHDITGKLCPKWFVEHKTDWFAFKEDIVGELGELRR